MKFLLRLSCRGSTDCDLEGLENGQMGWGGDGKGMGCYRGLSDGVEGIMGSEWTKGTIAL